MMNEVMVQSVLDGAHFSIAEMMLANVQSMLRQPLNIESYAVDTQYVDRETLTLVFPGDIKLQAMITRPKK